jgi:hypothetical protein
MAKSQITEEYGECFYKLGLAKIDCLGNHASVVKLQRKEKGKINIKSREISLGHYPGDIDKVCGYNGETISVLLL